MIIPYGDLEIEIEKVGEEVPWWEAPGTVRDIYQLEVRGPFGSRFDMRWWSDHEDHRRRITRYHKLAWNAFQTIRRALLGRKEDFDAVFLESDFEKTRAWEQAQDFSLQMVEDALRSASEWWDVEATHWKERRWRRGKKDWIPPYSRPIPAPPSWFVPQYFGE